MSPARLLLSLLLLLAAPAAEALVVAETADAISTVAPADDFGFANIAKVFDTADGFYTSGVYVGSGWLLTAYHAVRDPSGAGFLFGNVELNGAFYDVDPASAHRLSGADGPIDLALIQLTQTPAGLPSFSISGSVPPANSNVVLAGNGITRAATETLWNVNTATNPDTWTETAGPAFDQHGFYLTGGQAIRWGTNRLDSFGGQQGTTTSLDDGFGTQTVIKTTFDSGLTGEAQAADGDSGGGLFFKRAGKWELLGILITTSRYDGQPSALFPSAIPQQSAVFGNETYAIDLASYRADILAIVPEPASGALMLVAGGLIIARRHRPSRAT
jgi:hypothetical protein